MSLVKLIVKPGEEVIETLTRQAKEHGITNGAIVSLIGAVDSFVISNMPHGDAKADVLTEYNQPAELSGTGEITEGKVHLHPVLGTEGDAALAGHLHHALVETHFVHAYIHAFPRPTLTRPAAGSG